MGELCRFAAAALAATALCLLLRRSNPELQVPLGAALCCFVLWGAVTMLSPARELLERLIRLSGLGSAYLLPVAKCVAIGILSKTAADLCRDGGQSAMAGAVELGSAAAALCAALPLITSLLGLLEKLL